MRSPQEIQAAYYARTATNYDTVHVSEDHAHDRALAIVSASLNSLDLASLLDVGTGTGRAIAYLQTHNPGVRLHGIDPVPELLAIAAVDQGLLSHGDGEELPFADDSFDAVAAFGVMHHAANPARVVDEMKRVAKRAVFISDGNRYGQGSSAAGILKLALCKTRLWRPLTWVRSRGKGYYISEGDGLFYSYSVYDSLPAFDGWADNIQLISTGPQNRPARMAHPLLSSSHILLCAVRAS